MIWCCTKTTELNVTQNKASNSDHISLIMKNTNFPLTNWDVIMEVFDKF